MIRLYAVSILPMQDDRCFMECYLRSQKERRDKADALKMPADKARCIAAGLLLSYAYKKFREEYTKELAKANSFGYAINKKNGMLPEELPEIATAENGKPYFDFGTGEKEAPIYFNVSHSGEYVICAVADREVGADIQRATRVRESLMRRFFSVEERKRVEDCGENEMLRERCFASLWTEKEAAVKLSGRGIGQLLEKVIENVTEAPEKKSEAEPEQIVLWQGTFEEYAWAVACYTEGEEKTPGEEVQMVFVEEGELFYG